MTEDGGDKNGEDPDGTRPPQVGDVANIGEPIRLTDVNLYGVIAESIQPSQEARTANVLVRTAITSDDKVFHRIADNLCGVLQHYLDTAGAGASLHRANTILLVAHEDGTAELWVDTAAQGARIILGEEAQAGQAIFERDIADVLGIFFPCVSIGTSDRVLCLFRVDWGFGLCFDFNPEKNLKVEDFERALGTLYRRLRYRHLYETMSDETVAATLLHAGWFPFIALRPDGFVLITNAIEAGFSLEQAETEIVDKFTDDRLDKMMGRWFARSHFKSKEALLRDAIQAYKSGLYGPAIKTLVTEIEGVLREAHQASNPPPEKITSKKLVDFAVQAARDKTGDGNTLFLSDSFARYLLEVTFANFDPSGPAGKASSKNAVSHGAADGASYTKVRALQAILTLDQLAFFT